MNDRKKDWTILLDRSSPKFNSMKAIGTIG
jgi:hypothetical protein